MNKVIRIGTRDSELALWQAHTVQKQLEDLGYTTELITLKSTGDLLLNKPLYELGIVGVFTRNLDIAMLNEEIDIAVHSLKDVPTILPKKIIQAAVLKRADYNDILVFNDNVEFMSQPEGLIATGSLRRTAQWLHRHPTHKVVDLRGNVNTRLQKLKDNKDWNGAIFAAAGLQRIKVLPENHVNLNWMIPAPAQGAIMITALEDDEYAREACAKLNHEETEICTTIERDFLNLLEGGCTSPIGALAQIKDDNVHFKGVLFSRDGKKKIEISKISKLGEEHTIAKYCVGTMIEKGAKKLMAEDEGLEKSIKVFSTKKLSNAQKKLLHNDIAVEDSDFIKIRFNRIPPKAVKNEIENVIITSQNAVESLFTSISTNELQFKNIYCVGRRTKRLIEKRIGKVKHSENNAKKLAEYLVENIEGSEVTFFCSDIRLDELPVILTENNIKVNEVQAYKTMFSPVKVDDKIEGVLFYSPSTVHSFLLENKPDKIAFCIGETTALEAKKHFSNVKISKLPTVESIIELVNLHFINT